MHLRTAIFPQSENLHPRLVHSWLKQNIKNWWNANLKTTNTVNRSTSRVIMQSPTMRKIFLTSFLKENRNNNFIIYSVINIHRISKSENKFNSGYAISKHILQFQNTEQTVDWEKQANSQKNFNTYTEVKWNAPTLCLVLNYSITTTSNL